MLGFASFGPVPLHTTTYQEIISLFPAKKNTTREIIDNLITFEISDAPARTRDKCRGERPRGRRQVATATSSRKRQTRAVFRAQDPLLPLRMSFAGPGSTIAFVVAVLPAASTGIVDFDPADNSAVETTVQATTMDTTCCSTHLVVLIEVY